LSNVAAVVRFHPPLIPDTRSYAATGIIAPMQRCVEVTFDAGTDLNESTARAGAKPP